MVRAIAELSRSMSITTVAEYIETEAIAQHVAGLGVDYGQGFAIGKPIALTELLNELPLPNDAGGERQPSDIMWYAGATP
jgi:EAL domain-containing protein (putative c-di-GMP-specific phosphodiesterase class I)